MKYIKLIKSEEYDGPFSVLFYIHNEFSNYPDNYKLKQENILFKEKAIEKADSLFNSLNAYYNKKQSNNEYKVSIIVLDKNNNIVYEKKN